MLHFVGENVNQDSLRLAALTKHFLTASTA